MDFPPGASGAAAMRRRCAGHVSFTATAAATAFRSPVTAPRTCAAHRSPLNTSRCHGLGTQRVVADVASDCVYGRTEFNLVN